MEVQNKHLTVLSLGSNLGDKVHNIEQAISSLEKKFGQKAKVSAYYLTEPVGFNSDEKFLNVAIVFNKYHEPEEVLKWIREIEASLGRKRIAGQVNDRNIDIDILFAGNQVVDMPELKIPHPRLHKRGFVLVPLMDLIPDFEHPVLHKPIWELYDECKDESEIEEFE